MSSLNAVFDIAKSALMATQKAMNVTSHNISNANTDGYTRQRAELTAKEPVIYGGLYFGTGVDASNIQRVYDSFNTIHRISSASTIRSIPYSSAPLFPCCQGTRLPGGTSPASKP